MMRIFSVFIVMAIVLTVVACQADQESEILTASGYETDQVMEETISLPEPQLDSDVSLEQSDA